MKDQTAIWTRKVVAFLSSLSAGICFCRQMCLGAEEPEDPHLLVCFPDSLCSGSRFCSGKGGNQLVTCTPITEHSSLPEAPLLILYWYPLILPSLTWRLCPRLLLLYKWSLFCGWPSLSAFACLRSFQGRFKQPDGS